MSNALTKIIEAVPEAIIVPLSELVQAVLAAPNQRAAIERARFYASADAAKLAADELLRKDLG